MNNMPERVRKECAEDPFYQQCIHARYIPGHTCKGPLTWEHAWIYGGRQIQERWAIVPCCQEMNLGVYGRNKDFNRYISLLRAMVLGVHPKTNYPKRNWDAEFDRLHEMFYEMWIKDNPTSKQ